MLFVLLIFFLSPQNPTGIPSRLTLANSKEYEDAIKSKLVVLARNHPEIMDNMLARFNVPDSPSDFDSMPPRLATARSPAEYGDITELILNLKSENMLPALVFHLDMFELFERFKHLLNGLEVKQKTTYPNMHRDLEEKLRLINEEMQHDLDEAVGDKEKEEVRQRYALKLGAVDIEQPHQDFILGRPIAMDEIRDIVADIQKEDKLTRGTQVMSHALIRGLRRGIAIVVNHVSFQAYRRNVLRLAMQGKLAVVFSDVSLAYGVNMPFRSCVFCGDMGGQLDTLMLQQMSGRAGRRGMDTQGHLIYAGTSRRLINELTLGVIPAITGVEYRYHTQNLHEILSEYAPPRVRHVLSLPSLADFISPPAVAHNFDELSTHVLLKLRFILRCRTLSDTEIDEIPDLYSLDRTDKAPDQELATPSGFRPNGRITALLWMVWELRTNLPESVLLGLFLPILLDIATSRSKTTDYGQEEEDQFEFFALLSMLIDRKPCRPGAVPLSQHPWVAATNNRRRQDLQGKMSLFTDKLAKARDVTLRQDMPVIDMIMFPLAGEFDSGPCAPDLDGTLFAAFYAGNASFLPRYELRFLMDSIWNVGNTILKMHNAIWPNHQKFGKLRFVLSKCHARLNYLVREILTAHIDVPNLSLPDRL